MKKSALLLSLCALGMIGKAQPYTGMTLYPHTLNSTLSSGNITSVHSNGFLMAGYIPNTSPLDFSIFIDKTDQQGDFTSTADFQKGYQFFAGGSSCAATAVQQLNCYGVSVVETSVAGFGDKYILAAAFDPGYVYGMLDNSGNVNFSSYFQFPITASAPSKPVIVESSANPGFFNVCGSYFDGGTRYMYVMQMNASGTPNWSYTYDIGPGTSLEPRGIIETPYPTGTQPELVIVGVADPNVSNLAREGFLIVLDGSNNPSGGSVGQFFFYGSGSPSNEEFNSISIAPATASPFIAYVVGGYTDANLANGSAWMITLVPSGGIVWSTQIMPSGSTSSGPVTSVIGRYSNFYSADEYYGTILTPAGSIVAKLDNTGGAFSATPNQFVYNPGSVSGFISQPAAISFIDQGGAGINDGIHVYGTDRQSMGGLGEFYLTQAYFNGASANCTNPNPQSVTTLAAANAGPNVITAPPAVNPTQGLNICTNHMFTATPNSYLQSVVCSMNTVPTTPYTGSNNRQALLTGINKNSEAGSHVSLQPNPFSEKLGLHYTASTNGSLNIRIMNSLGQLIKEIHEQSQPGEHHVTIDFSSLNIESGIYFITSTLNGKTETQKIIYTK